MLQEPLLHEYDLITGSVQSKYKQPKFSHSHNNYMGLREFPHFHMHDHTEKLINLTSMHIGQIEVDRT